MKTLMLTTGFIFFVTACTTTHKTTPEVKTDNAIKIEEELVSKPVTTDTTKKKVKLAKPGLISDKTRDAIADGLVDGLIRGKIKEEDTEQDPLNAQ